MDDELGCGSGHGLF